MFIRQLKTAILALAVLSAGVAAQKKDTSARKAAAATFPELIWRDPGDMALLDLKYGVGGAAEAPDPAGTYTFVSEDLAESSPKFNVTDGRGITWKVKLGEESQPETAATRFVWAAGYFVDEDHYMAELTVRGLPTLKRGQQYASPGGIVHGARLERKPTAVKKLGNWDWFDNPFLNQRELNGLRVMMSFVNNWDLKQVNNAVYAVDGERHYAISDLGASFGKTGNSMQRTKGVPTDYQGSKFISGHSRDFIDFELNSRPFILGIIAVSNYLERSRMEGITQHIPRADARWLGQRLSQLTDDQIRDAFRASGYGAADVDMLARTVRQRIAALEAL